MHRFFWLGIYLGLVGCNAPAGPISDDEYVEVMARLSHVQARFIDPVRGDSARQAVLHESGVARQDLVGFAEVFGGDPAKMFRLHERIRARADSLDKLDGGAVPSVGENPLDSGDEK
ncbi:MAG: hypothetical protein ACC682_05215 [Gemmatimonadota bacterium]